MQNTCMYAFAMLATYILSYQNQRKHFMIDKTLVYSGAILTVRTKTNLIFKLKESFYCRVVNKREPQFHER